MIKPKYIEVTNNTGEKKFGKMFVLSMTIGGNKKKT